MTVHVFKKNSVHRDVPNKKKTRLLKILTNQHFWSFAFKITSSPCFLVKFQPVMNSLSAGEILAMSSQL